MTIQFFRLRPVLVVITLAIAACNQSPGSLVGNYSSDQEKSAGESYAYDLEIQSLNQRLQALENGESQTQSLSEPLTPLTRDLKRVYLVYSKASLTADYNDFKTVEQTLDAAIEKHGELYDLLLFRASFYLKVHRLQQAKQDLLRLAAVSDNQQVDAMLADIALQQGDYSASLQAYEAITAKSADWDLLARLAYYLGKTGNINKADELYHKAQEQLSYQQMRPYAWLELQRGLLDFDNGDIEAALKHYQTANRAYSGYWLIEEHLAEAYQLSGNTDSAIKLYRKIVQNHHHPEYLFALAQLEKKSDPEHAHAMMKQANVLFNERNALYPEASQSHYIKCLLERQEVVHSDLLAFAEQAYADRPYAETQLLLAKAQLKTHNENAARATVKKILASPWRTAEINALAEVLNVNTAGIL